jgi:EAL domain-containing protein (putative c-di-GMP-specific phosphodiesterase class I)
MKPLELNLDAILAAESILTHFQPLVSIKNRAVIGLEALSRGMLEGANLAVPPGVLFQLAQTQKDRLALDRLCRKKAVERFAPLYQAKRDLLLSLNLDTRVLYRSIVGSGHLLNCVRGMGVSPNNVIIEILESNVKDEAALAEFITAYRGHGFLIALDDIGAGHSNLDRISSIKPDIIKIDRSLIRDIDQEHHKYEIAKSLVRLAGNVGAMAVAEGVERQEEVLTLMELGVDIFQGFYFCKPREFEAPRFTFLPRIRKTAEAFKAHMIEKINAKKLQHKLYEIALENTVAQLVCSDPAGFDRRLVEAVSSHQDLECLYVLDEHGIQVSSSVCNPEKISETKRFIYHPAPRGADHSLKEYFLPLSAGLKKFTSEPYISLASGNLCITIASTFECAGHTFILCVDMSQKALDATPSEVHAAVAQAGTDPAAPGATEKPRLRPLKGGRSASACSALDPEEE